MICKEIDDYIVQVRHGEVPVCQDQLRLCEYIEQRFSVESIHVDESQLRRYLDKQKFFPFRMMPWEKFVFALHNCTYRADGLLR